MDSRLIRKEIHLNQDILKVLAKLANLDGRPIKNYMERVLVGHAKDNAAFVSVKEYTKPKTK